jgi:hypothetical protein
MYIVEHDKNNILKVFEVLMQNAEYNAFSLHYYFKVEELGKIFYI